MENKKMENCFSLPLPFSSLAAFNLFFHHVKYGTDSVVGKGGAPPGLTQSTGSLVL